jgi:glycerol uptake facilitator-like aquaporin
VIAINFAGTALTGCGLNPSEIFGIALITNQSVNWSVVWIYIVGPITGALIIGSVITLKVHSLPNDELC